MSADYVREQKLPLFYSFPIMVIIAKIPAVFSIKARIANCHCFILESPISPTPISSGNGEAMIIAPITGSSQEK